MSFSRLRFVPQVVILAGLIMLANVLIPITLPLLKSKPKLIDPSAVSAAPNVFVVNVLGVSHQDNRSPQSWFELPASTSITPIPSKLKYFTISIPRLGMDNITVEINGTDLQKNAIHFPGTVLPGSFGNSVIFGHSSLPQLYRPENPVTIFNPLLDAQIGDQILVNHDGVNYTYIVKDIVEVNPSQVEVLSQKYDRHQLTLITCTPLGTYWKRFVVKAELEK